MEMEMFQESTILDLFTTLPPAMKEDKLCLLIFHFLGFANQDKKNKDDFCGIMNWFTFKSTN